MRDANGDDGGPVGAEGWFEVPLFLLYCRGHADATKSLGRRDESGQTGSFFGERKLSE